VFELPSFRVGRLFGIPLEVNLSWLLIFGLVSFSLAFAVFPAQMSDLPMLGVIALAVLTALAFFFSIVLHELAHSLVARAGGVHVERITLFMLGGVSQMDEEPHTAGREFVMALAGPAMSFVLAVLCFGAATVFRALDASAVITFPLEYLAYVNFFVGLFNLLPGFPLDGGRVLRSILWGVTRDLHRSTLWAARIGQIIGWGMVVFAGVSIILYRDIAPLWFGLIGWFVASLAGQAHRQETLRGQLSLVHVRSVMTAHPESVQGDITLETLAHDHFLGGRHSRYPVMLDGHIIGLITLPDVKAVARQEWLYVMVADVTERDLDALTVDIDAPLDTTVDRLSGDNPGALLVVENGRLVGILTRADLLSATRRMEF